MGNDYLHRLPQHSDIIREIFPQCKSACGGVDLDNVEVKERRARIYQVYKKDMDAEYILFYAHPNNFFTVVATEILKPLFATITQRGFRQHQINKISQFKTHCYQKIKDYINNLRNEFLDRHYDRLFDGDDK